LDIDHALPHRCFFWNDPEESEDDDNLKYWNPMEKGSDGRYPIGALFVFYKELLTRTPLGNLLDNEVVR